MTVLKGYSTLEEAHLGRSLLASEGIDAQVLDEATAVSAPYLLMSSGVRLAVADEDVAHARKILGLSAGLKSVPKKPTNPLVMALVVAAAIFTVLFFGVRQNQASRAEAVKRVDVDRNGDKNPDERKEYNSRGELVAGYADDNFDGVWDRKQMFERGVLASAEQDRDFDGGFDASIEYQNGVVSTETIRPSGQGHPLFRHEFRNGVLAASWSDLDRDSRWDERIDYDPMGREIQRSILK